jgi:twitching motility protein PilT
LCQRLDYVSSQKLRVPRCELLLGSVGARGTIRSGTFSQLANVIQSGGEEGMWSFDRYGRWIEQRTDWVVPRLQPRAAALPGTVVRPPAPAAELRAPAAQKPKGTEEGVGLAELSELIDKLERRGD